MRKMRGGCGLVRAGAVFGILFLLAAAPPPASAGRPRPVVSPTTLYTTTRSVAELPVVLQANDAASLAAAVATANQLGCGVHIDVSGSIDASVSLTPRCATPDELGIRIRGPATLHGGVFVDCVGADCAWASVEGLRVVASDDAFDASHDARLAVLDCEGEVDGQYNNVLTAHHNASLLALSTSGWSRSSLSAPPLAFIGRARALIAGYGEFRSGTAAGDAVLHVGGDMYQGADVAILGHTLRCGAASQYAVNLEPGLFGHARLAWAGSNALCPVDLQVGQNEQATVGTYGAGQVLPIPFPIPAWLLGTAFPDVAL